MRETKLKLAILAGPDSAATRMCVSAIAANPSIQVVAILSESRFVSLKQRIRNLRRNVKREGWRYLYDWMLRTIQQTLDRMACSPSPSTEVKALLRQAFPGRAFSLIDFERLYGIPTQQFKNLNSPEAAEALRSLDADLGIVLGTRVLRPSTFSVPRMGCLNLHKGKVPDYRGLPPGFWELYDGKDSAGVTVHFVDAGLDTGDVVGEGAVSIHPRDTPTTLRRKLDVLGSELLVRCVADLAEGGAVRRPQPPSALKARTKPTRRERQALNGRLGAMAVPEPSLSLIFKTAYYLAIFYSGFYDITRAWRKLTGANRTCILLYHRVNDLADDVLTTSVERFAEHLVALRKYYPVVSTSSLIETLRSDRKVLSSSVVIHFDDCYRDVYTQASPLLVEAGFPACSFISSGFVDSDRVFQHDAENCPFSLQNLRSPELRGLISRGIEIGAHTVNHVDLGRCSVADATNELHQSKSDLEKILGCPVPLFSYPYGREQNIRPEIVPLVREIGYEAMFSAHGGFVSHKSNLFDIPRVGMSGQFRPLDLLMEIEGFSFGAMRLRWASKKRNGMKTTQKEFVRSV
ncbi:MAG TPA: polysaccharide deacetylase family protein [Candidatus Acidoferrum sp.]|nr:polysaccharide deacetylase family protein [Candidatus Acidoferrum sp.]